MEMKRILLVDDEEDIREYAKRYFEKRGIEVCVAETGEDAVKDCMKNNYDLILLDLNLGGISGLEVLKSIRETKPETKVILLSGSVVEEDLEKVRRLGITKIVAKPIVLDALGEIVMEELR